MPSAPPSSVDRFVGRQAELTSLQWALERSGGGAGRVVLLSGEPGVGKTRLAEHFADRCAASGREVHWARCWEWGGAPALWPWIQLVRSLCGVAEALSLDESARTALRDAERMLSPEQVGAAEVATTADGRAVHFAILDAVCAALATVSKRAPLLLLIDDLHAADPSSIQLLRFFARDTRRRRVLVVATCRMAEMHCSEEVAGLLGALPRDCAELHVVGLGAGELRELAAGLTDAPLSDAAVQRLLEATDGNALYVQGVLQEAMAAGSFDLERHTAPPRGLRDAIERRLSVLGPEDRQVLEVAAVLGHDAPVGVIARAAEEVWGVTRTAVERAIDWALRESLLREVEGGRGRVRFAHSLIADALSRQLGAEHRARLHAAVGEGLRTLGDDGGVQATRLARHFLAAGPAYRRAGAAYAAAAAKRAFAVCAYDQAALLHERVLEAFALDGSQEPQAIAELLLGLARARQLSGRNQAARAALRRAGQLDVDAATFARASLAMAETTGFATHDKEAAAMLEEALTRLQQVEQGHARELRARVLSALARQLSHAADSLPRRLELIAHARALMHDLPDPAARVRALSAQLAADWNPESLAERLELTEELVDTTATLGDAVAHLEALRWRLNALWEQGQTAEANATLDAYCGVAAELKWPQAQFNAALRLVVQAEIATVLPALQDAIDRMAHWAPRTSDPHTDAHLGGVRMSASWLRGDVPAMTASYEAFQTMIGVFRLLPAPDALQINYELLIGETDRARRRYERYAAADFSNVRTGFGTVCAYAHLAEACRAFEDRDRAARLIEILTPYADRLAVAGPVTCAGSVRRSLGCLELLRGDVPAAVTHLERAHGASVRMGAAGWQARAALDLADALTRRGEGLDLERAAELREAHPDRPLVFDARPPSAQGLAATAAPPAPQRTAASREPPRVGSLYREGDVWQVAFDGKAVRLRDSRGLYHLQKLLAQPGTELHALEMSAAEAQRSTELAGDAGPVLDDQARAAYRNRVEYRAVSDSVRLRCRSRRKCPARLAPEHLPPDISTCGSNRAFVPADDKRFAVGRHAQQNRARCARKYTRPVGKRVAHASTGKRAAVAPPMPQERTPMGKSASVINRYMAAMADGPQGAPVAAGLLTEDFKFEGPMLQANNRAAFLEGMKMMGSMKPHFTMLKQFEDGQDVCSVYEMRLGGDSAPAVVMTEVSVVRDGLIASQRLMYDAEAMKSAMAK